MPTAEVRPLVPLAELIAAASDDLTPSERRLAAIITDDPTAVAFATVADIARRVDISGPTVVRFATKLGFDGYSALQSHARQSLAAQLRRPTDRLRQGTVSPGGASSDTWDDSRAAAIGSVEAVFRSVTSDQITSLATPIATSPGRVWIVSSDTASPAAHVLDNELSLLRPGVHHLTGSGAALTADLIDSAAGDIVIAIDTPRYEHRIVDTVRWLADLGAVVVAITDGPLSPLASLADTWCQVDVHAVGPFDSALPTLTVVELVVAEVARQLRGAATGRLDRAETLWALHGVFIDD
jgi:DNA-binding MurR/RpiR family transcriptional regulator